MRLFLDVELSFRVAYGYTGTRQRAAKSLGSKSCNVYPARAPVASPSPSPPHRSFFESLPLAWNQALYTFVMTRT